MWGIYCNRWCQSAIWWLKTTYKSQNKDRACVTVLTQELHYTGLRQDSARHLVIMRLQRKAIKKKTDWWGAERCRERDYYYISH